MLQNTPKSRYSFLHTFLYRYKDYKISLTSYSHTAKELSTKLLLKHISETNRRKMTLDFCNCEREILLFGPVISHNSKITEKTYYES